MNGVARAFISTFFGWIRSTFNGVWSLFQEAEGSSFIDFFIKNWYVFAAIIIGLGLLIDFTVYLLSRKNKAKFKNDK